MRQDTVALLLTDIVDSTALTERLGAAGSALLWSQHDRIARDLVRQWRGREIDKADGFLLLFDSASDALGCVLAYHQALTTLDWPLRARAGLHVAAVTLRQNPAEDVARGAKPMEVDGLGKTVAARLMATALGGQTLLTADACAALTPHDGAAPAARLLSHGHWRLKGLPEPIELFEAGLESAPFTPPPDAAKCYRVVRQGDLWQPARELRHSLPAERDAFVGRQPALQALAQRFEHGARLVSLLGLGGSGKTRLALRFGRTWLGDYPGGVWFCDLAGARDLDALLRAVALGLDLPLGSADPTEQIGHAIAGRGVCLVIFDNFEQVARLAEATLGRWLDRAPQARLLVTSRELLCMVGEEGINLPPLDATEAEALFLLRARSARQGYQPDADDLAAISTLVRLLDGLPLAIELAAARVRLLAPRALLPRMRERFKLLSSAAGRPDRQATLRAAFDWSWDLMAEADRAALAQLSVFEGGFTLEAAQAVLDLSACDAGAWGEDAVGSLVDKSFVRALGDDRFDLLASVQDYAAEHLRTAGRYAGSGAAAALSARARHGAWFAALGPARATAQACADLNNLLAACRRALRRGDATTAGGALEGAWAALRRQGPFKTGVELAEAVCAMAGLPDRAAGRAHLALAQACYAAGRLAESRRAALSALAGAIASADQPGEAEARLQAASLDLRDGHHAEAAAGHARVLRLSRQLGLPALECAALNGMGNAAANRGAMDEARAHYAASLAVARRTGDRHWQGSCLGNLGGLDATIGQMAPALAQYEEALQIARALGDRQREGNTQANLGWLHQMQGQPELAIAASSQALRVARELGHARLECTVLCNLGISHAERGDNTAAADHYEAALWMAQQVADRQLEGQCLGYLGLVLARRQDFERGRNHLAQGEALLRQVADLPSLGVLLCGRAECEWHAGQRSAALDAGSQARQLAERINAGPASELGQALARVAGLLALPA